MSTVVIGKRGDIKPLLVEVFRNKDFFDIEFKCSDGSLFCHKFIIGAQSTFLRKALLEGQSDDPRTLIHLPDVRVHHMQVVKKFLYTGRLKITSNEISTVKALLENVLKIDARISLPEAALSCAKEKNPGPKCRKRSHNSNCDSNPGEPKAKQTHPVKQPLSHTFANVLSNVSDAEETHGSEPESKLDIKSSLDSRQRDQSPRASNYETLDLGKQLRKTTSVASDEIEIVDILPEGSLSLENHLQTIALPYEEETSKESTREPNLSEKSSLNEEKLQTHSKKRNGNEQPNNPPKNCGSIPQAPKVFSKHTLSTLRVKSHEALFGKPTAPNESEDLENLPPLASDVPEPSTSGVGFPIQSLTQKESGQIHENSDLELPFEIPLPPPIPMPPAPGMVIKAGVWVHKNQLSRKQRQNMSNNNGKVKKYTYKPKIYTITGKSKMNTYSAATEKEDSEYPCPYEGCDNVYDREKSLQSHISRNHHPNLKASCPECGKKLSSSSSISKHLLSHRPRELWPIFCPLCERKFQAKGDLPRHLSSSAHKNDNIPPPGSAEFRELCNRGVCMPKLKRNKATRASPLLQDGLNSLNGQGDLDLPIEIVRDDDDDEDVLIELE